MFKVNDKVDVFENGELVTGLDGEVVEVTEDTVFIRPVYKGILIELQELMGLTDSKIPHNLEGFAQGEGNEGYSIKPRGAN